MTESRDPVRIDKELFATKEIERQWLKNNMLTVQKLIDWLQKQDPDALIYRFEVNTGDYQEIPANALGENDYFETVKQSKNRQRKFFKHAFQNYADRDERVKKDLNDMYKYTQPNGIIVRL